VLELAIKHYELEGYTDLEVRDNEPADTHQARALQLALENQARERPIRERRAQNAVKRQAAMPDTRFVTWGEFKRAVHANNVGLDDDDPVASILCDFPIDLDGEPLLTIERDNLGIYRISFQKPEPT
jgi:hypothetical protein